MSQRETVITIDSPSDVEGRDTDGVAGSHEAAAASAVAMAGVQQAAARRRRRRPACPRTPLHAPRTTQTQ